MPWIPKQNNVDFINAEDFNNEFLELETNIASNAKLSNENTVQIGQIKDETDNLGIKIENIISPLDPNVEEIEVTRVTNGTPYNYTLWYDYSKTSVSNGKTYAMLLPEDIPSGLTLIIHDTEESYPTNIITENWAKGSYLVMTVNSYWNNITIDKVIPPNEIVVKMSDLQSLIARIEALEGANATIAENLQSVSNTLNEATDLANSYIDGGAE